MKNYDSTQDTKNHSLRVTQLIAQLVSILINTALNMDFK